MSMASSGSFRASDAPVASVPHDVERRIAEMQSSTCARERSMAGILPSNRSPARPVEVRGTRRPRGDFMRHRTRLILVGALALTVLSLPVATSWVTAADHIDSPAAVGEPTADITDLFAWTSEVDGAARLNLVLDVHPFASSDTQFPDSVQYVFHVGSTTAYGEATTETEVQCQFSSPTAIECWAGEDYVAGDPT
ncbi:MAG TPA: hypothetical protein DEF51_52865, partial [Myxococcales bacterium]|nr:hypothetical protein [Myxococcales bacterium]